MDVLSPYTVNQTFAFARMSGSNLSWRFSRRGRVSSSRSALLETSLWRADLSQSAVACANQAEMLCAVKLTSRASCVGLRPALDQVDHWSADLRRVRELRGLHVGLLLP